MLQVPVDAVCHSTFGELFVFLLLQRRMLCIGLYRPVEHMGQSFSYVYTNPDPWTELQEGDRAMVLHTVHGAPGAGSSQFPGDAWGFAKRQPDVASPSEMHGRMHEGDGDSVWGHAVAGDAGMAKGSVDVGQARTGCAVAQAAVHDEPVRAAPLLLPQTIL